MNKLKWWMRIIGLFYVFLMVANLPPVVLARLGTQYRGLTTPVESVAVQGLADIWFTFGVDMGMVGVMLLVASRAPWRNRILVYAVLLLELVRGIVLDVFFIARGYYANEFMVAWIVIHSVIIVAGWISLRQAEAEGAAATDAVPAPAGD